MMYMGLHVYILHVSVRIPIKFSLLGFVGAMALDQSIKFLSLVYPFASPSFQRMMTRI